MVGKVLHREHVALLRGHNGILAGSWGVSVAACLFHGTVGNLQQRGVIPAHGAVGVCASLDVDTPPGIDEYCAIVLHRAGNHGVAVGLAVACADGDVDGADALNRCNLLVADCEHARKRVNAGNHRDALVPEVLNAVITGRISGHNLCSAQTAGGSQRGRKGLESHNAPARNLAAVSFARQRVNEFLRRLFSRHFVHHRQILHGSDNSLCQRGLRLNRQGIREGGRRGCLSPLCR